MPSLYEATATVGDVSSSNFTTLYNASNLSVPNAGGGSISGNLNVAGNLTVQGSSLLIGSVVLQNSLSLPNYTFPTPDGTTDQVITTDGSGNLYWASVSTLPGASYTIQADAATGGANLSLVSSLATDSVKFAGGTNITVSRTDANTITISTTADDIPNGTAQGQVLYWNGSAWVANTKVTSVLPENRFTTEYRNSDAILGGALQVLRNYDSTAYTTSNSTGILYLISSNSQPTTAIGQTAFTAAADPAFVVLNSTDNFATRNSLMAMNTTGVRFDGVNIVLNANHTGTPTLDSTIRVERGSSTDATLTWDETQDRWEFNNVLEVQGQIIGTANLDLNGSSIALLSGTTGAPSLNAEIVVDRGTETDAKLTWNETSDQWELTNDLVILGGDLKTTQTVGNLFNDVATTVNIGNGATTEVNLGNDFAGRVQIKSPLLEANGDLQVDGGNINLNGVATAGVQPFITFATQPDGVNSQYGIRGASTQDDPWFVGAGSTGDDQGYLEIATGDNIGGSNNGGQIYVRQYNGSGGGGVPWYGGTGSVVNQLTLLDNIGNTVIPNSLTVDSGSLFVDAANNRVGVNTLTPSSALQVVGDVTASGATLGNISVGITNDNTIATTTGNLTVTAASGVTTINGFVTIGDDIQINGNDIKSSTGATALTLSGADVTVQNDLSVNGVINISNLAQINATSTTIAGGGPTTTVASTTGNLLKAVIYITDNVTGNIQALEALMIRGGVGGTSLTTYGEMSSAGTLVNFTATDIAGTLSLRATVVSLTNSTTIEVVRTTLS